MQQIRGIKDNFVQRRFSYSVKPLLMMVVILLLGGCMGLRGRTQILWKYTFEYPPTVVKGLARVDDTLQVALFTVVQNYNSTAMVYQPDAFKLQQYQYSKWRVNPADMVTDYLLRDMRNQNLFKAVYSYREPHDVRFTLEGEVEQFVEIDEPASRKAVLSVYVTLLDSSQKSITKMIVFQKNYQVAEPLEGKGPPAFVKGMSRAMEKLSQELIQDLSRAASKK